MKHLTLMLLFVSSCPAAFAWGKRGHQIVSENAAILVSDEPDSAFMRARSFDFGYYANIPDFIWKRPATYEMEKPEHFMDLEVFNRIFSKRPEVKNPLELSRTEFNAQFPDVPQSAGRAFWRIREMEAKLQKVTQALKDLAEEKGKARQDLQERWLLIAGPLSHYVGDLSMPFHVSENYDGQLTGQKGIHHYFEEEMVDQLYPDLAPRVLARAKAAWPVFKKKNSGKTVLQLLQQQTDNSMKDIAPLLKLDQGHKRAGDLKDAKRYEDMIIRRLADATVTLAEIYRRNLGFKWDENKFYFFAGEPPYMKPGEE